MKRPKNYNKYLKQNEDFDVLQFGNVKIESLESKNRHKKFAKLKSRCRKENEGVKNAH